MDIESIPTDNPDARWSGPVGDVLVEIKRSSNASDVRDALIGLAYALPLAVRHCAFWGVHD